VKMFSHFILFIKKCYKFCTSNAICKEAAAINCITTVQHKARSLLSTLTVLNYGSKYYKSGTIKHDYFFRLSCFKPVASAVDFPVFYSCVAFSIYKR
jgi:hypothetical protein